MVLIDLLFVLFIFCSSLSVLSVVDFVLCSFFSFLFLLIIIFVSYQSHSVGLLSVCFEDACFYVVLKRNPLLQLLLSSYSLYFGLCIQDPEYEVWFLVEVYKVGEGASINQTARFANVTVLESDDPRGLVYFAQGSRLPVVTLKATSVSLQVYRDSSTASNISVKYRMQVRLV